MGSFKNIILLGFIINTLFWSVGYGWHSSYNKWVPFNTTANMTYVNESQASSLIANQTDTTTVGGVSYPKYNLLPWDVFAVLISSITVPWDIINSSELPALIKILWGGFTIMQWMGLYAFLRGYEI